MIQNIKYKPIYIKQPPFRYCGQCQIKVITEFFLNQNTGKISVNKKFVNYSPNLRSRRTGFIKPITMLEVFVWSWLDISKVDKSDYIFNIKKEIDEWHIILMTIWHGYINDKKKFNVVSGVLLQHYISVRWYDDEWLYIYDSSVREDIWLNYDIGNLYISWKIFIKSYDFAISKIILSIWSFDHKWSQ